MFLIGKKNPQRDSRPPDHLCFTFLVRVELGSFQVRQLRHNFCTKSVMTMLDLLLCALVEGSLLPEEVESPLGPPHLDSATSIQVFVRIYLITHRELAAGLIQ